MNTNREASIALPVIKCAYEYNLQELVLRQNSSFPSSACEVIFTPV
jgi:hypothetical protein